MADSANSFKISSSEAAAAAALRYNGNIGPLRLANRGVHLPLQPAQSITSSTSTMSNHSSENDFSKISTPQPIAVSTSSVVNLPLPPSAPSIALGPSSPALSAPPVPSAPSPSSTSSGGTNNTASPRLSPPAILHPHVKRAVSTPSLTSSTSSIVKSSPSSTSSKLSSAAASAAAALASAKPKERSFPKTKLFSRQGSAAKGSSSPKLSSKPKPKNLTVQTLDMQPPVLARTSKELERIASINLTGIASNAAGTDGIANLPQSSSKKHHMPVFRSHNPLSSSSSNSKLVADSLYSFQPQSPSIHKTLSAFDLSKNYNGDTIGDDAWHLFSMRIMPLFAGDGLRVPVEDMNTLVTMNVSLMESKGVKSPSEEFQILIRKGLTSCCSRLKSCDDGRLVPRLTEVWLMFFNQILPYLEAVLLPLVECAIMPDTRRVILVEFRDAVVLPISDRLEKMIRLIHLDFDSFNTVTDAAVRILQCASVLSAIQSGDEEQLKIDKLKKTLRNSWLNRRPGNDRRGFVYK